MLNKWISFVVVAVDARWHDVHIRPLCCVVCFTLVSMHLLLCHSFRFFFLLLIHSVSQPVIHSVYNNFFCFALLGYACMCESVICLHDWSPVMRCRWSYERSYDFYSVSIGYYLPIHSVVLSHVTIFFLFSSFVIFFWLIAIVFFSRRCLH